VSAVEPRPAAVLVIGGGGREHALAFQLAQSAAVGQVFVAPGNPGTAEEAGCENVGIAATDVAALTQFALAQRIDLTVVGPEAPLAAGVVDSFRDAGLPIWGPTRAAAQLESSKAFAKDFMARHRIPTAAYEVFTEAEPALRYVRERGAPIVIKADGLAAGKGVFVATTVAEAEAAVVDCLGGRLGAAGARVVIESFLEGEELSFICLVDGHHVLPLASSQDHKRRDEGDFGPNTGGMGAYSPAPVMTDAVQARVLAEVIHPVVQGMALEGTPFTGFLYAGLMIGAAGEPRVLEFNTRMGDPETQPILMRLQSDLYAVLRQGATQGLNGLELSWRPEVAVGITVAAAGYPEAPRLGDVLSGIPEATQTLKVFHAGTRRDEAGQLVTAGGRVLTVTALGNGVTEAQARALAAVGQIQGEGLFHRRDIGWRAIARERGHPKGH